MVVQLGFPPQRIDLLTGVDGVDFEACYPHRVVLDLGGVAVSFIGLDQLLANKRASGRPQDLADLAALTRDD